MPAIAPPPAFWLTWSPRYRRWRDPQHQLTLLAERQQALSGRRLLWRGTYEHAAECFLTHLERQMETALLQARTFDTLALADSPAMLTGG
jgi:hypothetical protein